MPCEWLHDISLRRQFVPGHLNPVHFTPWIFHVIDNSHRVQLTPLLWIANVMNQTKEKKRTTIAYFMRQ